MSSTADSASLLGPRAQPWLWTAFLALVMALPLARGALATSSPALPVLGTVPAFRLIDEHGGAFGPERLAGRVWLANFIFTRCPSICPEMTDRLVRIQKQLGDEVDLVSVSVDPAYDTPERMRAFAEHHHALSPRWHFLTGESRHVQDAVLRGFRVAFSRDSEDIASIAHGVHVVLVDGRGRIRGFYDSNDADALERLVTDARRLADHPGA